MKKNKLASAVLVVVGAVFVSILAWRAASDNQSGPTQVQVQQIQAEMKAQVPAAEAVPFSKEKAEAGMMMRGPAKR